MAEVIRFCFVCWCAGSILLLGALFDWKVFRLSYLSTCSRGIIVSRIFHGIFGLILLGVGLMIFLAPW